MDLSLSPVAFNTDTYPPFTSQLNLFSFSTTLSLSSVFSSLPVSILPHLFLLSSSHSLTPRDSYSLLFFYFLSIHNQQLWDEDFFFLPFLFFGFLRFLSDGNPFSPPPFFFLSELSRDLEIQALIIYNPDTALSPSLHRKKKSHLNLAGFY